MTTRRLALLGIAALVGSRVLRAASGAALALALWWALRAATPRTGR